MSLPPVPSRIKYKSWQHCFHKADVKLLLPTHTHFKSFN
jgi:hypothetical protein